MKKVIYDFGSNNGDDIPYYLFKADLVVAVEANPTLCDQIRSRFSAEIKEKRLVIECCVINDVETNNEVPFFIHERNDVLSQFPEPDEDLRPDFFQVYLPSKTASQIVQEHGEPYYIKIDIEHYDVQILKSIFDSNIRPPYISAEIHNADVFKLLSERGEYNAFKLVDGHFVSTDYAEQRISTNQGEVFYSFPFHSAGPFGEDIHGRWILADSFKRLLSQEGLGWKDIHATSIPRQRPIGFSNNSSIGVYLKFKSLKRRLRSLKCQVVIIYKKVSYLLFSSKYGKEKF